MCGDGFFVYVLMVVRWVLSVLSWVLCVCFVSVFGVSLVSSRWVLLLYGLLLIGDVLSGMLGLLGLC